MKNCMVYQKQCAMYIFKDNLLTLEFCLRCWFFFFFFFWKEVGMVLRVLQCKGKAGWGHCTHPQVSQDTPYDGLCHFPHMMELESRGLLQRGKEAVYRKADMHHLRGCALYKDHVLGSLSHEARLQLLFQLMWAPSCPQLFDELWKHLNQGPVVSSPSIGDRAPPYPCGSPEHVGNPPPVRDLRVGKSLRWSRNEWRV